MAHVENDLARIKGIGPKHAEMLKSIGVDSMKELRHRKAANLKEMIEERHGPVIGLSLLVVFFNLFGVYYSIARWLFLRDTGRKLLHLDRQLGTADGVLDDLGTPLEP